MELKDLPREVLVALVADRDTDLAECHKVIADLHKTIALLRLNVAEQEREYFDETARARAKALADSLRISDLMRANADLAIQYNELKEENVGLKCERDEAYARIRFLNNKLFDHGYFDW